MQYRRTFLSYRTVFFEQDNANQLRNIYTGRVELIFSQSRLQGSKKKAAVPVPIDDKVYGAVTEITNPIKKDYFFGFPLPYQLYPTFDLLLTIPGIYGVKCYQR